MAETKPKSPEEILHQLLQSGNAVDPYAPVDAAPYTPQYGQTVQEQAQGTVDLQYGAQQRAIELAAQQAAQENQYSRTAEKSYGNIVDPRIANVYSALGSSLTQGRGETQTNYQSAIDKIRGYYDEATGAGQQVNTDLLNRLTESAERLGVGAAIPEATKGLSSDYQFQQGQLGSAKAGRSANLAGLSADIYGLDTARIGSAAREGAQARSGVQQEVLKTLGQLLRQNQKEQGGFRSQLTGLSTDKALDLRNTIEQLGQQRSREGIEGRKSALEEFLGRAGLASSQRAEQAGLAQHLQGFGEQQRQFNEQIRQSELDRASAAREGAANRAARGSGGAGDPLLPWKMANYESLIQSRIKPLKGQEALDVFLNTDNKYWQGKHPGVTAPVAGPKFRDAISKLIPEAIARAQPRAEGIGTGGKFIPSRPSRDPYEVAVSLAKQFPPSKGMNQEAIRAALDAFFKGLPV